MSAYSDAMTIDATSSDERLGLAAEVLADGSGIVLFDNVVALRRSPARLLCEVLDPAPGTHRCASEYEVLVENARRALDSSRFKNLLPEIQRRWAVVEDCETAAVELWHAP